jgi:imidazolonepropionase-like amidohydrolase
LLSVAGIIFPDGSRLDRCQVHLDEHGKIAEISRELTERAFSKTRDDVLDRRDYTLIPLLADAHLHLAISNGISESPAFHTQEMVDLQLSIYLRHGIGHVLSLGTDQHWLELLAASRQQKPVKGLATPYSAGTGFGAPGGWPPELTIPEPRYRPTSPDQARKQVRLLVERGIGILKLWVDDFGGKAPKMSVPVMRAIIEEAHNHGLKALAHVYFLLDAKDLVNARIDALAHSIRDQLVTRTFADDMARKGVRLIPTLSREEASVAFSDPENAYLKDPLFQLSAGDAYDALLHARSTASDSEVAGLKNNLEIAMQNLRTLHSAGVEICMGTDAGFRLKLPGFSEHRELALMHKAGLSASEVLAAATGNNYSLFAIFASKLAIGQSADFCLLGGDPLRDLSQVDNIREIWQNGVEIWPRHPENPLQLRQENVMIERTTKLP